MKQYQLQYTARSSCGTVSSHVLDSNHRETMATIARCILTRSNTFQHKLYTLSYGEYKEVDAHAFCMDGEINFLEEMV